MRDVSTNKAFMGKASSIRDTLPLTCLKLSPVNGVGYTVTLLLATTSLSILLNYYIAVFKYKNSVLNILW